MRIPHPNQRRDTLVPEDLAQMANEPNATDVLGSYTGTPRDGGEPVQDVDDL